MLTDLRERIGRTRRNESMFGPPGIAYVYRIYGVHWCLNAVTHEHEYPAAVLIRALEPLEGISLMQHRRATDRVRDLARGPGRLTVAMAIDRDLDGIDLCVKGPLWLAAGALATARITSSVRIGISREAHHLRRFFERSSPYVSGARRLKSPAMIWRVVRLSSATRRSALARAQAAQAGRLIAERTGADFELVALATTGDLAPNRAVRDFDTKGLFVDRPATGRRTRSRRSTRDRPRPSCGA